MANSQNLKTFLTSQNQTQMPLKNSNFENLNQSNNDDTLVNQLNTISKNSFDNLSNCQTIDLNNNFQSSFIDKQQQNINYQQIIENVFNSNHLSNDNNNLSFMPQSSSKNAVQSFLTNYSLINNLQQSNIDINNNQSINFNYFFQNSNFNPEQNSLLNYFNTSLNYVMTSKTDSLIHLLKNEQPNILNISKNNINNLNYNPVILIFF